MGRVLNREPLGDVLVDQGFLNRKDLSMALARLGSSPGSLGQALVAEGLITEEQLVSAVAEQHGLPFDLLMNFRVDPKYFQTISIDLMHRHPFVPLGEQDGVLTIAIPDPQNLLGLDELELLLNRPLRLVVTPRVAILAVLARSEGSSQALKELEAEYRGTTSAAGWPIPDEIGPQDGRFSGLDPAERVRRVRGHPDFGS